MPINIVCVGKNAPLILYMASPKKKNLSRKWPPRTCPDILALIPSQVANQYNKKNVQAKINYFTVTRKSKLGRNF